MQTGNIIFNPIPVGLFELWKAKYQLFGPNQIDIKVFIHLGQAKSRLSITLLKLQTKISDVIQYWCYQQKIYAKNIVFKGLKSSQSLSSISIVKHPSQSDISLKGGRKNLQDFHQN